MGKAAFSVFFFATGATPHRGLPGQFECFLDASRAARKASPGAAVSSTRRGSRYAIFKSSAIDAEQIGEIIADHKLLATPTQDPR